MGNVTIYSLSACPWCKKAKKYFDERHVPYDNTEYDLVEASERERIERDMRDLDAGGFPVVKIGRHAVVGYRPELYEELLRETVA